MTKFSEEGNVKGLGWVNAETKDFTHLKKKDKLINSRSSESIKNEIENMNNT